MHVLAYKNQFNVSALLITIASLELEDLVAN